MSVEAEVVWTGEMQFVGRAGDGPAVVMDTPEGGSGASPMELLLMGTAGCTAVDVISILKKKRMQISGLRVHIRGQRDEAYPRRYTDIHLTYVVRGNAVNPAGVEQAIDLSEKKYCGAMASLNARITHSYRIE